MNERKGVHKIMAYNTLTEREAFYCLCHVPGFGSATIGKLRERFGTYQEVWTAKEQEIQKAGVLTEKRVTVFLQARGICMAEGILWAGTDGDPLYR